MSSRSLKAVTGKALVIALALAMGSSCSDDSPVAPPSPGDDVASQPQDVIHAPAEALPPDKTPFQESMQAKIAEWKAQGLPVPAVTYEYQASPGASKLLAPGEQATVVATTTFEFENPEQAGETEWPAFVVEDHMPPGAQGFVNAGDYTEAIRDRVEQQFPGIWDQYEFGHEPRTYTYIEEYTLTGSDQPAEVGTSAVTLDQILMGFTYTGPKIHVGTEFHIYIFGWELAGFKAGFDLDWGIGLRLPMELGLASAGPLFEGSASSPTSTAQGLDWTATDFSNVGVAPENGNEFVLRFQFFLGVRLVLFGIPIIDYSIDIDTDASDSFQTPFGPGQYFDLPSLDIEIYTIDIGVANGGFGFALTPKAGSDKYTASWTASGDATGSGTLEYTDPTVPVPLSSVLALDGPGTATVKLDNLDYWLNQFLLELAAYFRISLLGLINGRWDLPLADFDLSGLFPDLKLGVHDGTAGTVTMALPISNVPPTAGIDISGATTIQGVPTFLLHTGEPLAFVGTGSDPGQDDLTLNWDWDDGGVTPDVSTVYPVPGSITETQMHACQSLCLFSVGFEVVDDDGASAQDQVAVVSCGPAGTAPQSADAWIAWIDGVPAGITADLDCQLAIVSHMSGVFGEIRDASTPEAARAILAIDPESDNGFERLDRELLLTWLNFGSGAFDYPDLVDTNEDGIPDTALSVVMDIAEALRRDPFATNQQLFDQITMLRAINEPNAPIGGI